MIKLARFLFYIVAVLFYASAIIAFFVSHDRSMGVVWINIDTVKLVLSGTQAKKE